MNRNTWSSVDDVMKDLGMPRRRGQYKGHIDKNFIVVGERPPPLVLGTEDTEEEYIKNGDQTRGLGEDLPAPDLGMIKQMLTMVEEEVISSEKMEENNILEISKMNPLCDEFVPKNPASGDHIPVLDEKLPVIQKRERKNRNVALKSILQNLNDNKISMNSCAKPQCEIIDKPSDVRLLTPMDFMNISAKDISNFKIVHAEEAITEQKNDCNILNISPFIPVPSSVIEAKSPAQIETPIKQLVSTPPSIEVSPKKPQLILNPTRMFKRKPIVVTPEKQDKSTSDSSDSTTSASYVPSPYANEMYKEFMIRKQKREEESLLKNYWEDVIDKMKEIDSQSCQPNINEHPGLSEEEFHKLAPILLPSHRHKLTEDCVVCLIKSEKETKLIDSFSDSTN